MQDKHLLGPQRAQVLISQFGLRWSSQWLASTPKSDSEAILRAWLSELEKMPAAAAARAWTETKARPYPPDLGFFLAASRRKDHKELFMNATRAASMTPPAWHLLSPLEYSAAIKIGGYELRNSTWDIIKDRWTRAVDSLTFADDTHQLEMPPKPTALLKVERNKEMGNARLAECFSILNRPPADAG